MHNLKQYAITGASKIRDLICYHRGAGNEEITCKWRATPPVPPYNMVFSTPEGHEIFRLSVMVEFATKVLHNYTGDAIIVNVNSASTIVYLPGMSNAFSLRYSHSVDVVQFIKLNFLTSSELRSGTIWSTVAFIKTNQI